MRHSCQFCVHLLLIKANGQRATDGWGNHTGDPPRLPSGVEIPRHYIRAYPFTTEDEVVARLEGGYVLRCHVRNTFVTLPLSPTTSEIIKKENNCGHFQPVITDGPEHGPEAGG